MFSLVPFYDYVGLTTFQTYLYEKHRLKSSFDFVFPIDWFAFQEALGDMGYMGIMDLEGPAAGARPFRSESMFVKKFGMLSVIALGIAGFAYLNKTQGFGAEVEVVDGLGEWHEI